MKQELLVTMAAVLIVGAGCTRPDATIGTAKNPLSLVFIPGRDKAVVEASARAVAAFLEKDAGLVTRVSVPPRYIDAIAGLSEGKGADVAFLNDFGYLLAREEYGAKVLLKVVRGDGRTSYRGAVVARADGPIARLADLAGRKVAFADPYSTAGFVLTIKLIKDAGVTPGATLFAKGHDAVVRMVYEGKADAGAIFASPVDGDDARRGVERELPDVMKKVKVVAYTDEVPNEPVVFRRGLPPELAVKVAASLSRFAETPGGGIALGDLSGITGFKAATDADYDGLRKTLRVIGKDVADMVPGGWELAIRNEPLKLD